MMGTSTGEDYDDAESDDPSALVGDTSLPCLREGRMFNVFVAILHCCSIRFKFEGMLLWNDKMEAIVGTPINISISSHAWKINSRKVHYNFTFALVCHPRIGSAKFAAGGNSFPSYATTTAMMTRPRM